MKRNEKLGMLVESCQNLDEKYTEETAGICGGNESTLVMRGTKHNEV